MENSAIFRPETEAIIDQAVLMLDTTEDSGYGAVLTFNYTGYQLRYTAKFLIACYPSFHSTT